MSQPRAAAAMLALALPAGAATLTAGPGKQYPTPCRAIAAASAGDVIEIDPVRFEGDVCTLRVSNLTLRATGGARAHLAAAGRNAAGKGIWVILPGVNNTVVENIEFSGASVDDRNGAGIRVDVGAGNLTVRNCHFHDNENGMLVGDSPQAELLIENSIFEKNGYTGGTHNLYVNHIKKFTFRGNYSARAVIGHLVKTRAGENHILYNRLSTEDGTGSRAIDVSNGGLTYVIGNLLHQGRDEYGNRNFIGYQREGPHPANPSSQLYVSHNTFVHTGKGQGEAFLEIDESVIPPVVARNNIFMGPARVSTQRAAILENNFVGDARLVNVGGYDFSLCPGSPAIDQGIPAGVGDGLSLAPAQQYVHTAGTAARPAAGAPDVGALEYMEGGSLPPGACPEPANFSMANGASFATDRIAPGSIASIFGTDFESAVIGAADVPLPRTLGRIGVTVNGVRAPLFFASPTQINLQIPSGTATGFARVQVWRGEQGSPELLVNVQAAAPGIFLLPGTQAVAQNDDYTLNGQQNPTLPFRTLTVYMTGQGQVTPPVPDGAASPASPLAYAIYPYTATIGGRPAPITFLGLTPGLVGVLQANVVVPDVAAGEHALEVTLNGVKSNTAKVWVGR